MGARAYQKVNLSCEMIASSDIKSGFSGVQSAWFGDCTHPRALAPLFAFNGYDDFTSRVSLLKIPDSLRNVAQPETFVDNGRHRSGRH